MRCLAPARRLMNTRFHDHDHPLMRNCSKISAIPRYRRILNQKTTFHISKNTPRSTQHRINQQVPLTGRATTIFQYSKNLGRHDLLKNNASNQISKFISRTMSQRVAHDSLRNAPLAYPHIAARCSRQSTTLTMRSSPLTTDPSPCFTFHEGSL